MKKSHWQEFNQCSSKMMPNHFHLTALQTVQFLKHDVVFHNIFGAAL